MQIQDNKAGVPLKHYLGLYAGADAAEMSARSGVRFEDGAFRTVFLGRELSVGWPAPGEAFEALPPYSRMLILRYLLNGRLTEASGKFLAYSETPWGEVYNQNFKGRCIMRLAFGFGRDLPRFHRACLSLKGVPAAGGDAAYDIEVLPGLTVRLILWEADEEFPPSSQILFSDNFPDAMNAEDLAVCGDVILDAMKRA